jgi:predicted site-specific integrase-resolvase
MAKLKPKTDEEPLSPELQQIAYSCPEILKILGIHYDTLQRWRKRGIAPPHTTLPGRKVIFFKDSFVQWMRNREQQPKVRGLRAPVRRRAQ